MRTHARHMTGAVIISAAVWFLPAVASSAATPDLAVPSAADASARTRSTCHGRAATIIVTVRSPRVVHGTGHRDVIAVHDPGHVVRAGRGDDLICGSAGPDAVHGGPGGDHVYAHDGHDTMHGDSGADHLYGQHAADDIYGDSGRDHLFGGTGDDRLYGGSGEDWCAGDSGHDQVHGEHHDNSDDHGHGHGHEDGHGHRP